jgi:hypothetical protein
VELFPDGTPSLIKKKSLNPELEIDVVELLINGRIKLP